MSVRQIFSCLNPSIMTIACLGTFRIDLFKQSYCFSSQSLFSAEICKWIDENIPLQCEAIWNRVKFFQKTRSYDFPKMFEKLNTKLKILIVFLNWPTPASIINLRSFQTIHRIKTSAGFEQGSSEYVEGEHADHLTTVGRALDLAPVKRRSW